MTGFLWLILAWIIGWLIIIAYIALTLRQKRDN